MQPRPADFSLRSFPFQSADADSSAAAVSATTGVRSTTVPLPPFSRSGSRRARTARGKNVGEKGGTSLRSFPSQSADADSSAAAVSATTGVRSTTVPLPPFSRSGSRRARTARGKNVGEKGGTSLRSFPSQSADADSSAAAVSATTGVRSTTVPLPPFSRSGSRRARTARGKNVGEKGGTSLRSFPSQSADADSSAAAVSATTGVRSTTVPLPPFSRSGSRRARTARGKNVGEKGGTSLRSFPSQSADADSSAAAVSATTGVRSTTVPLPPFSRSGSRRARTARGKNVGEKGGTSLRSFPSQSADADSSAAAVSATTGVRSTTVPLPPFSRSGSRRARTARGKNVGEKGGTSLRSFPSQSADADSSAAAVSATTGVRSTTVPLPPFSRSGSRRARTARGKNVGEKGGTSLRSFPSQSADADSSAAAVSATTGVRSTTVPLPPFSRSGSRRARTARGKNVGEKGGTSLRSFPSQSADADSSAAAVSATTGVRSTTVPLPPFSRSGSRRARTARGKNVGEKGGTSLRSFPSQSADADSSAAAVSATTGVRSTTVPLPPFSRSGSRRARTARGKNVGEKGGTSLRSFPSQSADADSSAAAVSATTGVRSTTVPSTVGYCSTISPLGTSPSSTISSRSHQASSRWSDFSV